jgi:uncharacterized membrane protein YfcA
MEPELYWHLFFFGLAGGFLAGLLGIGGGLVYIVILPVILLNIGVPNGQIAQFTIANSLFATMLASISAVLTHLRNGQFYWRQSVIIGTAAITSSSLTILFIVNQPFYSSNIFNLILIAMLIYMCSITLLRLLSKSKSIIDTELKPVHSIVIGTSGGVTAPLSGLGGSMVMIPLMVNWRQIDIKKAAVIANGVVFIQSATSSVINSLFSPMAKPLMKLQSGYILWPVAMVLGFSVILGSPLGAILSRKVSSKTLSIGFFCLLLIVLLRKIFEVTQI